MVLLILLLSLSSLNVFGGDLESLLQQYFKQRLHSLIIDSGQGRMNLDGKEKSYFIFTPEPNTETQKTYLIPMATSRYDTSYYSEEWLTKNNLSTNPSVFVISHEGVFSELPLTQYLLTQHFLKNAKNGFVDLYRGYSTSAEPLSWSKGIPARGARYWTPDLNYAWRYARRDQGFLPQLFKNQPPIIKFRVPVQVLEEAVAKNSFILGIELPKRLHDRLESGLGFTDHLFGGKKYLGNPSLGVDIELRVPGNQRYILSQYYVGQVSHEELLDARQHQIEHSYKRLSKQNPNDTNRLQLEKLSRLGNLNAERQMIQSENVSAFDTYLGQWNSPGEVFNNDFSNPRSIRDAGQLAFSCKKIIGEDQ